MSPLLLVPSILQQGFPLPLRGCQGRFCPSGALVVSNAPENRTSNERSLLKKKKCARVAKKKRPRSETSTSVFPPFRSPFDTPARTELRSHRPLSDHSGLLFNLTHRNRRKKKHPRFKKNTQQQSEPTTRRSTLAAGAAIASALAAALVPASPAQAFLGFGGASKDDQYATDTVSK